MLGAGAGTGFGAGGFFGAAAFGAAAFGAAAFGAAAFGAAAFRAAFAFGFAFLADFLAALFFFATTRFFLRAGAAFTRFFAFLVFDFAFFAFFAMIASRSLRLRIRFANATIRHIATAAASPAVLETPLPANASGAGPPVAQSISSTV
jgi:hypothetical protein